MGLGGSGLGSMNNPDNTLYMLTFTMQQIYKCVQEKLNVSWSTSIFNIIICRCI